MTQPQLCKSYTGKQNISGWFVEPKINGNRGIVIVENGTIKTISRNNKPIYNTAGVLLEVSYQTKTKDGSLIFPVFQRIRWDLC